MPVRHGTATPSTFKHGSSQVTRLYHGSNLVWSNVGPIIATADNTYVTGPVGQFTSQTTVTATGGSGAAKTFSWSRVSGVGTIENLNQAFTRFHSNGAGSGVFRCTVSDGTYTATVDVTAEWA